MKAKAITAAQRMVPDYGRPAPWRPPNVHRGATLCGAIPLCFGVLLFLLWLITRWESLPIAGFVTIVMGTIFVAAGIIALLIHAIVTRLNAAQPASWKPSRRELLILTLLLSNFPVAAAIVSVVKYLKY